MSGVPDLPAQATFPQRRAPLLGPLSESRRTDETTRTAGSGPLPLRRPSRGRNEPPASDARPRRCGVNAAFRRLLGHALVFLSLLSGAAPRAFAAAAPTLEHLYPAGAARGSTNVVAITGKSDPWPPGVWVDGPGVTFLAETNQNRFRVEVAADAPPGPRLVRLFNPEGASDPRFFVVGAGPEIPETEPNNVFSSPQAVASLPITINGRLDKNGDVDCFAIPLRSGQWLDARLDAYTLMSKLDGVFRLVDSQGLPLAWNHDDVTLDPRLTWRSPTNQTVVLQVFGFRYPADASIVLAGGEGTVYRLHLEVTDAPPRVPPAAGWPTVPEDQARPDSSPALSLPVSVDGLIADGAEIDRFHFLAPSNAVVVAEVEAARQGSPLDAWLRIEDAAGKELARNDDLEGSRDPHLEWKAPSAAAPYVAAVGSLTHRGGPGYRYRLTLRTAGPEVETGIDFGAIALTPGGTNQVKFRVKRLRGHTNELRAAFEGLPVGVQAAPIAIKAADTQPVLELLAATNAAPFNGPVRLRVTDPTQPDPRPVPFDLVSRGENNGVPQGYSRLVVDRTEQLWLTVRPVTNAPAAPAPAPPP